MQPHADTERDRTRSSAAPEMEECIKACLDCARACQAARAHAQKQGKAFAAPELLDLLLDGAESCELAARWMARGSSFHGDLCAVCASVCKSVADACAAYGDDETLQACAEACRRCFDTCVRMGQTSAQALVQ
jgi:hypothetical protein